MNDPPLISAWLKVYRTEGIEGLSAQKVVLDLRVMSYTRKSRKYNSYKGKVGTVCDHRLNRRFKTSVAHQMENFFSLLKEEIYYGKVYYSFEELKIEIERFINYYNNERIKERLGYMSPVEYRLYHETLVA